MLVLEVLSDLCSGTEGSKLSMQSMQLPEEAIAALKGTSPYFVQFLVSLLDIFRRDLAFLSDRGHFIIR